MEKITPHLWFDKEAKEAAEFYTGIFDDAKVLDTTTMHDTPSGDADVVNIELAGQGFTLLNAGPYFKFNPSISFMIACDTKEEVEQLWGKLSEGGTVRMELDSYPFSEKYGWTDDKYGVSWQIIYTDPEQGAITQKITPSLLFVGDVCGKAEEAINFYTSVFHDAKVGDISRYGKDNPAEDENNVMYAEFTLEGQGFVAMDSSLMHDFTFNEAVSLVVRCENQEEIDYYWEKLSAVPESEQCGWLKDKFGVSWQIVPRAMDAMMQQADSEKMERVTKAFLKMKKFDIAELEAAAEGK
jgi:predicted 3-demethylubiquinone-9 3-methyltransferase (glyoxalase superfamily)